MEKKGTSWGWIIFWLVIFWPVGLFLVVKKFASDKSAIMSGKTGVLSVVGWILAGFGGICVLAADGDSSMVIVGLLFIAGGVMLLRKASTIKKTAVRYKRYIDIVVNQNVRSIDNLVSAMGLSYDVVSQDIQKMIDIGYLKDAYIHQGNREIVLMQQETVPATYEQPVVAGQVQAAPQTTAARCPGCGANNIVAIGRVSECDYCGTPISA